MEILVCVKQVPDTTESELTLTSTGEIERDDLVYSINEADNYAVEEAVRIVEKRGGSATVVTAGDEEDEEVLRRELAMGAKHAFLIGGPAVATSDAAGVARLLAAFCRKKHYDLILTGAQADGGGAQIGGMLAATLDYPYASLVSGIEVVPDGLLIQRELEGGDREVSEIGLPCVLSIQTGINEPRYVGIRAIRQVASVEIPRLSESALDLDRYSVGEVAARVRRLDYFIPKASREPAMLQGSREEIADKVIELLRTKGGLN